MQNERYTTVDAQHNIQESQQGPIAIRPLRPELWETHKRIRLAALADAPYAFTTQWADVAARPDQEWEAVTARRASDPNGVTFFAYVADTPCAMAACIVSELAAEMLAVWVAPHQRHRGVGHALVVYAAAWARGRGASTLIVGVYADNAPAIAFYQRAGFQLTGEERFATRTDHRPILVMAMPLTHTAPPAVTGAGLAR